MCIDAGLDLGEDFLDIAVPLRSEREKKVMHWMALISS